MTTMAPANGLLVVRGNEGVPVPPDHIGLVHISATGRSVWWTGKVAIGLRYEPRSGSQAMGSSALRLQEALLLRDRRGLRSSPAG